MSNTSTSLDSPHAPPRASSQAPSRAKDTSTLEPLITVRGLSKSFGPTLVWEDVNMDVYKGETLAVIGRSGCGKSVLLKHFNALLKPTTGDVLMDGVNIFDLDYVALRQIRQRFGILFQGGALFDSITTFENIAFPLRVFTDLTEAEIRDRVMQALERVSLAHAAERSTAELSGGMRKRVGLARAIILNPEVLMYDEPTSGLDPQTSDEINDLILSLSETLQVTSIVITHDMHSVLKIADRVAFLHDQALHWLGTVEQLKQSQDGPLRSFVRASEYAIA